MNKLATRKSGFTIVELIVVIVVIAILVAIVVIGYGAMTKKGRETGVIADLASVSKSVEATRTQLGTYPATLDDLMFNKGSFDSSATSFQYSVTGSGSSQTYCLTGVRDDTVKHVSSDNTKATDGPCTGHYASADAQIAYTATGTFDTPEGTPASFSVGYALEASDLVIVVFTANYNTYVDSINGGSGSFSKFYEKSMGATGYQKIIGFKGTGFTGQISGSLTTHWVYPPSTQRTFGDYSIYVVKARSAAAITTTDTSYGNQTGSSTVAPASQTITKGQLAIFNYVYYGNTLPTFSDASTGGFSWTNVATRTGSTQSPKSDSRYTIAPRSGSVQPQLVMPPAGGAITAGEVLIVVK